MDTEHEQASTRWAIRDYVWRWQFGMDQASARTLAPTANVDPEIDAHFFAVALKNLRAAVVWGRDYCNGQKDGGRGGPLAAAVAEFDHVVPHVGDVRDVQEHFVEYAKGDGKLQKVPEPLAIWWERSDETVIVNVLGRRLDVAQATAAGHTLARTAMEVFDARPV